MAIKSRQELVDYYLRSLGAPVTGQYFKFDRLVFLDYE